MARPQSAPTGRWTTGVIMDNVLPAELTYVKVIPGYECSKGCHYCYNKLLNQTTDALPGAIGHTLDGVLHNAPRPIFVELIGGEPLEEPGLTTSLSVIKQLNSDPRCAGIVMSTAV